MTRRFLLCLRSLRIRLGLESVEATPHEWTVPGNPERVIALGDLHGDVGAFGAILLACGLVDRGGRWSGGAAHLVLVGDLVGGDRRSRLLLNAVLRLEKEAAQAGGCVHALLGNHDILPAAGRFGKFGRAERELYASPPVPGAQGSSVADAFRGDSVYARWLRRRRTMLKIGDTLFVHAGVDRWALKADPHTVNAAVSSWIAYWQGMGPCPDKRTQWTVSRTRRGGTGPLWTRGFKIWRGGRTPKAPARKVLRAILARYGVARVVVGHSPTPRRNLVLEHPRFGDAVVLIDTGISDCRRGRMSALEIAHQQLKPIYVDDRESGRSLEALEVAALEACKAPSPRWAARARDAILPASALALFGATALLAMRPVPPEWEVRLRHWIWQTASPLGDQVMIAFSSIAWSIVLAPATAMAVLVLVLRRQRLEAARFATTVVGGTALTALLKLVFSRPRPPPLTGTMSFPSGHVLVAACFYFGLAACVGRLLPRTRVPAFVATSLLLVAISTSRIFLGNHFVSDVVGALAIATLWIWFSSRVWPGDRLNKPRPQPGIRQDR